MDLKINEGVVVSGDKVVVNDNLFINVYGVYRGEMEIFVCDKNVTWNMSLYLSASDMLKLARAIESVANGEYDE